MAAATKELMWLSEKEEEEVGFDWSERNANMAAKKESYSVRRPCIRSRSRPHGGQPGAWVALDGRLVDLCRFGTIPETPLPPCQALMRELELKEKKLKETQSTGDRLLREDHPARPTVEVGRCRETPWCPRSGCRAVGPPRPVVGG